MHDSGSFIYTNVERIRRTLEQSLTDKYTDSYLTQYTLQDAHSECLAALNLNTDNPIFCKTLITVAADTAAYQLPPSFENIIRVVQRDDQGNIAYDFRPNTLMHPLGQGWRIEGNLIVFDPPPREVVVWEVWYIPSGDLCIHVGTGTASTPDTTAFTLTKTPDLGIYDRRPNAYVGAILRLLPPAGVFQERIIETFDAATGGVTVRVPFDTAVTDDCLYEIAPLGHAPIWAMIGAKAALMLGEDRSVEGQKLASLDTAYRRAKKSAMDRLSNMQARTGKSISRYTLDNPEAGVDLWRAGFFTPK